MIGETLQGEPATSAMERAGARAEVYRVLAMGFRPPGADLRRAGQDPGFFDRLCSCFTLLALFPLSETFAHLETALHRLWTEPGLAEAWALEYTRLFVGPGHVPAPPYESVYTDPDGRVMGEAALDALGRYRDAGLRLDPEVRDLPDHVALLTEFMAHLCEEEAAAWRRGDAPEAERLLSREVSFLTDHLLSWTSQFSARLCSATGCELYQAVARLVEGLPRLDRDQSTILTASLALAEKEIRGA